MKKKSRLSRIVARRPRAAKVVPFTREERIAARNEGMRRYIAAPGEHGVEFQSVALFNAQSASGVTPTHGETTEAYLEKLMTEMRAATAVV